MPIICFEGASAVGKTATAQRFKEQRGAFVVPEVNLLFERPTNESAEWYFERQVERFEIAQEQSRTHEIVILDGDVFQPLWYGWAFDFAGWQSLDFCERFYKQKIENKTIDFPDCYFVFSAEEAELRKRKAGDATRRRRNFEIQLQMIEPQRRYFRAMNALSPNRAFFLKAESIEDNVEFVSRHVSDSSRRYEIEPQVLFGKMICWLQNNKADD